MKNWSDIKIIVLGKSGTNKTQFVNKWRGNEINEENKATIVSEFGFKLFENEGKLYRVQLWDLAGCDINYMIIKSFGKDADGVVVMSCATNIITREDSIKWKRSVDDIFKEGEEIPCILVENNVDFYYLIMIIMIQHLKIFIKIMVLLKVLELHQKQVKM